MKTKLVKRHYCDFCSKGFFKLPDIVRHEARCTLNPKRVCKVCGNESGRDYAAIIAKVKTFRGVKSGDTPDGDPYLSIDEDVLNSIENMVDGCPACKLAIIRQGKFICDWDYRKAFEAYRESENYAHSCMN